MLAPTNNRSFPFVRLVSVVGGGSKPPPYDFRLSEMFLGFVFVQTKLWGWKGIFRGGFRDIFWRFVVVFGRFGHLFWRKGAVLMMFSTYFFAYRRVLCLAVSCKKVGL